VLGATGSLRLGGAYAALLPYDVWQLGQVFASLTVWHVPHVLQVLQLLQPVQWRQHLWPQPEVNNKPNVATNTVARLDRPISLDENAKTRMV
jgi:hypothetical protein